MLVSGIVGVMAAFVLRMVDPRVVNKAGPDWLWTGGRDDVVGNLYFRPNGSFRRFGLPALVATLAFGSAAVFWIVQRIFI